MFVTESLKTKVRQSLVVYSVRAEWLRQHVDELVVIGDDRTMVWAAERAFHVAVECMADIGNDLIDALVMRDPGSYSDILGVLAEEQVVSRSWFQKFEPAIAFRSKIVKGYMGLQAVESTQNLVQFIPLLPEFSDSIKEYLQL